MNRVRTQSEYGPRHGFTLVELLVVVVVMVALMGLLVPALVKMSGQAEAAATERIMGSLLTASVGFKQDHNVFPASHGEDPISRASGEGGEMLMQTLLGIADDEEPRGSNTSDGKSGPGFRPDGQNVGSVYGPYVAADGFNIAQHRTDFTQSESQEFAAFADVWDQPIAYYLARPNEAGLWHMTENARFIGADNDLLLAYPNIWPDDTRGYSPHGPSPVDIRLDNHPQVDVDAARSASIVLYSKGPDAEPDGDPEYENDMDNWNNDEQDNDNDGYADVLEDDVVMVGP